jgi:hypothetical protein
MRWLRREVIGDGNNKKICVISYRHATIKYIFENPGYDWHEETYNLVHRLCTQHIAENILKKFKNKYVAETFKKAARKNILWKLKEYLDQIEHWSTDVAGYIKGIDKKNETDQNESENPHK